MISDGVRHEILDLLRRESKDLFAINAQLARVEDKVDVLDRKFDGLGREFGDFRKELPKIVGDVMREVLAEDREKR